MASGVMRELQEMMRNEGARVSAELSGQQADLRARAHDASEEVIRIGSAVNHPQNIRDLGRTVEEMKSSTATLEEQLADNEKTLQERTREKVILQAELQALTAQLSRPSMHPKHQQTLEEMSRGLSNYLTRR